VEQLSSELKQLKLQRKIDRLKKKLKDSKFVKWLPLLHQMKRLMLHPKKKPRARREEREIRDPITLPHLTMIIYLTLAPSHWYLLVNLPVSMRQTIPNRDTR
jgi:Na+-transporting NADH:ubiquinone oxidoreductase subunit NqrB